MSEKRKLNIAMNYRIDEALFEAMSSYCSTHKITKQELVRNLLLEKLNVKDIQRKSEKAKFRAC